MKALHLLLLPFAFIVSAETTPPNLPDDVASFVERRDGCDHFRGEDPYNAERGQFLAENIRKLCVGTDQELAALKRKYSNNTDVISRFNRYEPTIEPGSKR